MRERRQRPCVERVGSWEQGTTEGTFVLIRLDEMEAEDTHYPWPIYEVSRCKASHIRTYSLQEVMLIKGMREL